MTLAELQQYDWYKSRPEIIQQAIDKLPPIQLYKIKSSGYQCYIISFEEPHSSLLEDVTCTVQKTGIGSLFPSLNQNRVFGISLTDLEPWDQTNKS